MCVCYCVTLLLPFRKVGPLCALCLDVMREHIIFTSVVIFPTRPARLWRAFCERLEGLILVGFGECSALDRVALFCHATRILVTNKLHSLGESRVESM